MISGATSFFSCVYSPGATKAQAWYSTQGSEIISATIIDSLTGTMNGVMTPVAIIFEPSGSALSIGCAMKS